MTRQRRAKDEGSSLLLDTDNFTMADLRKLVSEVLRDTLKEVFSQCFEETLNDCVTKQLGVSLQDLHNSVDFISTKLDDLNSTLTSVTNAQHNLNAQVSQTQQTLFEQRNQISSLERRLDRLQYAQQEKNVEIRGIPDTRGEDLHQIVIKLAAELDLNDPGLVEYESVFRLGSLRPTQDSPSPKHRPIILQLSSVAGRLEWCRASRGKKLNSSKFGNFRTNGPVYINEHLTDFTKNLLFCTKKFAQANNYRFVWVKDGQVLLRRKEGERVIRIQSPETLTRLQND